MVKNSINLVRRYGARVGAGVAAVVLPAISFGQAADTAVTAIEAQSARGVAIAGALLAMGLAIWAGMYIYRKFFK